MKIKPEQIKPITRRQTAERILNLCVEMLGPEPKASDFARIVLALQDVSLGISKTIREDYGVYIEDFLAHCREKPENQNHD